MYIFVYGTLKDGYCNHYLLEDAKFVCEAITKEKYPMVLNEHKTFPYLINKVGEGHHIKGEVYDIDKKTLFVLDILEGHPKHYARDEIVVINHGIGLKAMVYFLNDKIKFDTDELIEEF